MIDLDELYRNGKLEKLRKNKNRVSGQDTAADSQATGGTGREKNGSEPSGRNEPGNQKKRRSVDEEAVRKLSRKSMSTEELRQFLRSKEYSSEEIETEIKELKSHRYLDDQRFAWEYLQYAFSQNRSRQRAFSELRRKGVSDEDIQNAFMDYEDLEGGLNEKKMARSEAEKVLRMADLEWDDPVPDKIRGRIARRLSARGFSSSLIWDLLDELRRG